MKNLLTELQERGMVHQFTPGLDSILQENKPITAYVGFDPTADSLHVGNLAAIMLLKHLQMYGHTPIILVGGATGMIGDPSGKKNERQFLSAEILKHNQACITKQLSKFLDFFGDNAAIVVNNYDWVNKLSVIDFLRNVGKNVSINVMMNRDSVKNRIEDPNSSISFTEFTYQLIQAYDFAHLYESKQCVLQMGGSDQWGNMTAGIELIRKLHGHEAQTHALTCPLITKADGSKFGKSESGNVWLDPNKTSPFEFFQFWAQLSDEDAIKLISVFTLIPINQIEDFKNSHKNDPKVKYLQHKLAEQVTLLVHGRKALDEALTATEFLFHDAGIEKITTMTMDQFKRIFDKVPTSQVKRKDFETGDLLDVLSNSKNPGNGIFKSKGDVRRTIKNGGLYINKTKINETDDKGVQTLLYDKYWIVQNGKKNFHILEVI